MEENVLELEYITHANQCITSANLKINVQCSPKYGITMFNQYRQFRTLLQ